MSKANPLTDSAVLADEPRAPAAPAIRSRLLITHANDQDNVFSAWLASRLAAAGYDVWIDVRSLKGGDDFWNVIEHQLRHETVKQIVVVSRHVRKPGVLKELALGEHMGRKLGDPAFMIPIKIDELPFGDMPPELFRKNSLDAYPNWATCLEPLFKTLEEAGVPRRVGFDPSLLRAMVQAQEAGRAMVQERPETLLSNWFELRLPDQLTLVAGAGTSAQFKAWLATHSLPTAPIHRYVAIFCDPVTFGAEGGGHRLETGYRLSTRDLLEGRRLGPYASAGDAKRQVVNLLRQSWDRAMRARGLEPFEYASGRIGWFFPDGLIAGKVRVRTPDGRLVSRVLTGKFKTRRWHLCLIAQPRLWPTPTLRVHANMVLSEDGRTPLPGKQTQALRRRLTRSWWNDKWRDLLLAGMGWLAEGGEAIDLSVGAETLSVAAYPQTVDVALSYEADESELVHEEDDEGRIVLLPELDDERLSDEIAREEDGE